MFLALIEGLFLPLYVSHSVGPMFQQCETGFKAVKCTSSFRDNKMLIDLLATTD